MKRYELIAPCHFGLEAVLKQEITELGYDVSNVEDGRVTFIGDDEAICRSNIGLRTAREFLSKSEAFGQKRLMSFLRIQRIFRGRSISLLMENSGVAKAASIKSRLFSPSDIQSIMKKAMVERLKQVYHVSWFREEGKSFPIRVFLMKDNVTVGLDTTGESLHKRGYRKYKAKAPIAENLAAALIMLTPWRDDRILVDPFCGSGTIPIEAALMAANIAPGMKRGFTALTWEHLIGRKIWDDCYEEAREQADMSVSVNIQGFDNDPEMIKIAMQNARLAGVDKMIQFAEKDVKNLTHDGKYGFIITNPPYGERLEEKAKVPPLYRKLGEGFKKLDTWSLYLITAYEDAQKDIGRKADKNRKLYNGMMKTYYYQFIGRVRQKKYWIIKGDWNMQTDMEQNLLSCDGFEEGDYALTRNEMGRIIAQKRDRLYAVARAVSVCFAVASVALMAGFKLNEGFLDANSRIGILMESVNVQEDKMASPKINVRTSFRDEKKSRLVIPLLTPIEQENVSITEEFTQDKYVLTLSGYSEYFPDGLELTSDSAIMEAVGVYRQNDDVVVEIYCRDLYDCELVTNDSALTVNFMEMGNRYAARAVIWFPYDDKNRLALPEWRQSLEKFAADNRIRLYMAPDMREEYTQSDVIAFANEIHAEMVLGVEVGKSNTQQSYMTGICNTAYFIPDYNSTHLAVVMTETFSQTTQMEIHGFEEGGSYALVSEAVVPAAVVRLSLTQKDMESVENEYKLNQKIADSLERTMGGILENYLKVEESGNEG